MREKIVLASKNEGKLQEFQELLAGLPVEVAGLRSYPEIDDIPETGATFEENALIKARAVAESTGLMTVADDSGLEVDWLDGAPGVYSARFAGVHKSDRDNLLKLLDLLQGAVGEQRRARFRCVLAVVKPGFAAKTVEGKCEGMIAAEPRGESGFGYDPVFYLPQLEKTMAQLDMKQKNEISHRGEAFRKAVPIIKALLD